uniref:Uncharacterized protein n=1 Tax=Oncorhynchus tshawytscha TaxID=74940 RepID=A0A8C8FRF6_ONCTS
MDVIISAADMGFTGSLVGSKLTMFLMSMPREQSSVLLLCEPPHWCRRPNASWMSSSCLHNTSPSEQICSSRVLRETTSTLTCGASASGKISRKSFSSRLHSATWYNKHMITTNIVE